MAHLIPWIDERNRNKLIDALQRGQFPTFVDVLKGRGMGGTVWAVPSDSDPRTEHTVEHTYYWDGHQDTRCTCAWGQEKGPFTSTGHQLPCRHVLIVWFYSLPAKLRCWLLDHDYGLGYAWAEGLESLPPDTPDWRDPRWDD
jgi:hypothetical protein